MRVDLQQRIDRAASAPGDPAVIDTNILLEFMPPAQIDWRSLLATASVRLVIPLRVIEELDVLKYDRRRTERADRARRILPQLGAALGDGGAPSPLRDGTTIEVLSGPGPRDRATDADEELLHTCQELEQFGDRSVTLISGDTAIRLRAQGLSSGQSLCRVNTHACQPSRRPNRLRFGDGATRFSSQFSNLKPELPRSRPVRRQSSTVGSPSVLSTSFKIGDAFPGDDPVARFMTVVAMISNDWQRLVEQMVEIDDRECAHEAARAEQAALLITNYRLQAALHYEAARCLKLAYERFSEIRMFVDGLSAEAIDEYKIVVGGLDPDSPHYHGNWLSDARNATLHYSKLGRRERVGKGLTSAAEEIGVINFDDTIASVRFGFADKVALEWLGGSQPGTETATQMVAMRESVMAMTRFAQRTMSVYLASRGIQLPAPREI
jgi:hypothetical protein